MKTFIKLSAIALSATFLVACTTNTHVPQSQPNSGPMGLNPDQQLQQTLNALPNTVYFGFDQYDLSSDAMNVLQQNAAVLIKNPSVLVMLAGNADPRGSVEYNFHLGMRRAKAAYNYLLQQGVPAAQMCMVSYSDLKPNATSSQFGGDWKKAYAMNRNTQLFYNQNCTGWDSNQYKGGNP